MSKGGKRPGAGAKPKYGEKTKVMRVPESKVVATLSSKYMKGFHQGLIKKF